MPEIVSTPLPTYRYADVETLDGAAKVGSHQCVALVQLKAGAPLTAAWRQGAAVKGLTLLQKGTAIATFVNGQYPNRRHGNHAALYISQDARGILVMDQWTSNTRKPKISRHLLRFLGKDRHGNYIDPANNGDAFSVIN